jgi:NTE family protein
MASTLKETENVGVALSGGAVLGAAHIGALRALDEAGVSIGFVAGTSIGAFVAAMIAAGVSLDDAEKTLLDLDWLDISRIRPSRMGLLSNDKLGDALVRVAGIDAIEDAGIPLGIVATDISNGECVVLTEGDLSLAVRASTCVPGLFIPVEHDGKILVDGGLVDNVPVEAVRNLGADYVIAVDVGRERSYERPDDLVDVLVNSIDIAIDNATRLKSSDADFIITPELSQGSRTDADRIESLIQEGYESTRRQLNED